MKKRYYEYLPKSIIKTIDELALKEGNAGKRFDHYLKIVGTIYRKCLDVNGYAHVPHVLVKNYWTKVIRGKYQKYMKVLLDNGLVEKSNQGRAKRYNISLNVLLNYSEIEKVGYKQVAPFKELNDGLESRLRNRINKDLKTIAVDYDSFSDSKLKGGFSIDPDCYLMDIRDFPIDMRFDAEIHYPNIDHNRYSVKKLLMVADELDYPIYYDKDKIRIMPKEKFRSMKNHSLIVHSKFNLLKIKDGNCELSRDNDKTRRVFHAPVFLSSKALPFLKIDDEQPVGIDACTSHFLLLANLFKSFGDGNDLSLNFEGKRRTFIRELYDVYKTQEAATDVEQFYEDVVEKDFYDVIKQVLGLSQRSQAKIFCFNIIFSKPDNKNKFKKIIRDRYPTVINTLDAYKTLEMERWDRANNRKKKKDRETKKEGSNRLSINLQALESEIFVDHIYNKIHAKGISSFTKHDSIIVGKSNENDALQIANDAYKQLGLTPKFKVEYYNLPEVLIEQDDTDIEPDIADGELSFVHNIDNVENLGIDELHMLLEKGESLLIKEEYNHLESRIIEYDKNQLPLDTDSIEYLNKIIDILNGTNVAV